MGKANHLKPIHTGGTTHITTRRKPAGELATHLDLNGHRPGETMATNLELTGRTPGFSRLWHKVRDAVTEVAGSCRVAVAVL
jgi:hypothetical protein